VFVLVRRLNLLHFRHSFHFCDLLLIVNHESVTLNSLCLTTMILMKNVHVGFQTNIVVTALLWSYCYMLHFVLAILSPCAVSSYMFRPIIFSPRMGCWGCKNRAHSISCLDVIKGISNQGLDCSVS